MQRKRKKLKTAFSAVFCVVLVTIAAFFAFQYFFPQTAFNLVGIRFFRISYTKSMEPTLKYNDLIAVKKHDFSQLEKGDIITFYALDSNNNSIIVTHRIIDIATDEAGKRFLRTQGDNIDFPDLSPVTIDGSGGTNKYIGKLAFKSSFLGATTSYFSSKYGIFMLIINAVGVSVLGILLKKRN